MLFTVVAPLSWVSSDLKKVRVPDIDFDAVKFAGWSLDEYDEGYMEPESDWLEMDIAIFVTHLLCTLVLHHFISFLLMFAFEQNFNEDIASFFIQVILQRKLV